MELEEREKAEKKKRGPKTGSVCYKVIAFSNILCIVEWFEFKSSSVCLALCVLAFFSSAVLINLIILLLKQRSSHFTVMDDAKSF